MLDFSVCSQSRESKDSIKIISDLFSDTFMCKLCPVQSDSLNYLFHFIFPGGSWYRFVMTGDVTGGKLKTPADADSESLQGPML
jgi:hypothetical protein